MFSIFFEIYNFSLLGCRSARISLCIMFGIIGKFGYSPFNYRAGILWHHSRPIKTELYGAKLEP